MTPNPQIASSLPPSLLGLMPFLRVALLPAASVSPGSSLDMQIHGSTLTCQARAGTGPRRPVSRRQVIGVGTGVGELTLVHRELWPPGHRGKCGQLAPRPPPQAPARMPTAGLPSPPHTLQGPCSFLLPDPQLPRRSPGHRPAAVSIPCPWSEEHGPAQGSGPSTPSHRDACPLLPTPTSPASQGLVRFRFPLSVMPAGQAPASRAPPRDSGQHNAEQTPCSQPCLGRGYQQAHYEHRNASAKANVHS